MLVDGPYEKALDEGWTKTCTTKTVDIMASVNMMQDVKSGNSVDLECPFCDGNVVLMKNEDGHTSICYSKCDMRLKPESNP